jgi:hypothetical protein
VSSRLLYRPDTKTDTWLVEALIFVLLAVAALAGAGLSYYLKMRRRDELAEFAQQHGLDYSINDPFGLVDMSFSLFARGDGRGSENVLWGKWEGLPVAVTDFWYYDESTDSKGSRTRTYHRFSVAEVQVAAWMPHLTIGRENLLTVVAEHAGFHDIEFESEDFNRAFHVRSEDREFAYQLVDARMMQFLLSVPGTLAVEVNGPKFVVYCKKLAPMELIPLLGTAKGFHQHIPRLVWTQYGMRTRQEAAQGPESPTVPQASPLAGGPEAAAGGAS